MKAAHYILMPVPIEHVEEVQKLVAGKKGRRGSSKR